MSQFTSKAVKTFIRDSTLCYNDATVLHNSVHLNIKTSKTDIFRSGVIIRLVANFSTLCPVTALKVYLQFHPSTKGPLFMFNNGKFLTRRNISELLKKYSNTDANLSSHSFRIGAATTLANLGHPRWIIQSLGRWSSDCFRDYLRVSDAIIESISRSMVSQPTNMLTYDPDLA